MTPQNNPPSTMSAAFDRRRTHQPSKRFRITTAIFLSVPLVMLYIFSSTNPNYDVHHEAFVINKSYSGPFLAGDDRCRIPDVDPYDETIVKYIKPAEPIVCADHDPLTDTATHNGRQVLKIRSDILIRHYNMSLDGIICCYSVITRVNENTNQESKCIRFESTAKLDVDVEVIYVKCLEKDSGKELYKNMHAIIQFKPSMNLNRRDDSNAPGDSAANPAGGIQEHRPNILLLGIDSMSRLNLKRTMPRTVSYLQENNWVELRKYNKVGDNTFPNLMAVLTGLNEHQLIQARCWHNNSNHIDHCPFVWKKFRRKGYTTAYAEDEPEISTFNYNAKSKGFLYPPTEYYMRPFIVEAMKRLPLIKRDGHAICVGPTSTTDHFLKYIKDLLTTFHKSLFALIWFNNFSHENINTPAAVDERFLLFMKDSTTSGAFNNTIVIFFSDHGPRFNDIRLTYVGWLEERLPFVYIRFPDWFKHTYPDAYKNLVNNGDRLTSPYDLHLLLKDVVRGGSVTGTRASASPGCPKCVSLFLPVSVNRSCSDAGIAEHWCTCSQQMQVSVTEAVVRKGTHFVISEIGRKLILAGNTTGTVCAVLKLNNIISARVKEDSSEVVEYVDYVIVFETVPGLAKFDATLRYWSNNLTSPYQILGLISRINSYADQSDCVLDKELKLYCYCIINVLD